MSTTPTPNRSRLRLAPVRAARPELASTLVLVAPLFLLYEIGVLFTPVANGADIITRPLLDLVHFNRTLYMGVVLGATVLLAVWVAFLQRRQRVRPAHFLPVLLEATVYALSLGSIVLFVMVRLLHVPPNLAANVGGVHMGPFTALVMAAGAGLNEELVFRAIIFAGLLYLLQRGLHWRPWLAGIVAALASAALFSAVHHVGALGEPFTIGAFTFRLLCGLAFAAIFQWRGFAVVAWTHALYDAYVFFLR